MENSYVDEKLCAERRKVEEERQERDNKRIDGIEGLTRQLSDNSIRMGELLEIHDKRIENHDSRISTLENKPNKVMDKITSAAISAIVSGAITLLLSVFVK